MKGSLTQDGRRGLADGKPYWRLRVYAGQDPVTGKPRFRERGLRATKREAEQALRLFAAEVDAGPDRHAVLNDRVVADRYAFFDKGVIADVAAAAEAGARHDVGERPDAGSSTNVG